MNLNDLLNVKLYHDNMNMFNFNAVSHPHKRVFNGNDSDAGVLKILYERHVRKSSLMDALTLYQFYIVLRGGREATGGWRLWWATSWGVDGRTC